MLLCLIPIQWADTRVTLFAWYQFWRKTRSIQNRLCNLCLSLSASLLFMRVRYKNPSRAPAKSYCLGNYLMGRCTIANVKVEEARKGKSMRGSTILKYQWSSFASQASPYFDIIQERVMAVMKSVSEVIKVSAIKMADHDSCWTADVICVAFKNKEMSPVPWRASRMCSSPLLTPTHTHVHCKLHTQELNTICSYSLSLTVWVFWQQLCYVVRHNTDSRISKHWCVIL